MSDPHSLPDILAALEANAREIERYFAALPRTVFFSGDDACWGPAHHLSHLTLAYKRVGKALAAPEALPPNQRGRSRTYEQVCAAYDTRLSQATPEQLRQNPLPPRVGPDSVQAELVREFAAASAKMRETAGTWSEADCDARAVPHPFLGWLSAREMLLFFVIHDRRHHEGVRRRIEGADASKA